MAFKNEHLSYSRLTRFEQCPLSFKLHYVEKHQAEPGISLRFGKLVHAVLERLLREVVDDERSGPLSPDLMNQRFRCSYHALRALGSIISSVLFRLYGRSSGIRSRPPA